jgi:hypothetical protein
LDQIVRQAGFRTADFDGWERRKEDAMLPREIEREWISNSGRLVDGCEKPMG